MRCELCGKKVEDGQLAVPVGEFRELNREFDGIVSQNRGIHLDCLKEVVDSLRAIGNCLQGTA